MDDAPNAISTVVSTGVMTPRSAIIVAVIMNIIGATAGTAMAATVGKRIVSPSALTFPSCAIIAYLAATVANSLWT